MQHRRSKRWILAFALGLSLVAPACGKTDDATTLADASQEESQQEVSKAPTSAPADSEPDPESSEAPKPASSKPSDEQEALPSSTEAPKESPDSNVPSDALALPAYDPKDKLGTGPAGPGHDEVVLTGDASLGCVWVTYPDGEGAVAALWWPDYRARFNPVRVYDEQDRLVWDSTKESPTIGGLAPPEPDDLKRIPAKCRTGDAIAKIDRLDPV